MRRGFTWTPLFAIGWGVIVCAVFFVPPWWLGLLAILLAYILLPVVVLAGLTFHRGYWRAFFVGVAPLALLAIPFMLTTAIVGDLNLGITLPAFDWEDDGLWELFIVKLYYSAPLVACLVCGLFGVGIRAYARATRRSRGPVADDFQNLSRTG
jgi:hypothetical protein